MRLIPAHQFRELGLLLEINRRILHPIGLALELLLPADRNDSVRVLVLGPEVLQGIRELAVWAREQPELVGWPRGWFDLLLAELDDAETAAPGAVLRVQDHRRDPEGMFFAEFDQADLARVRRGRALQEERSLARQRALGYIVQPLEATP